MAAAHPEFVEDLGHGVVAIDTGFHRPRFDAAYLVIQEGRAAFVDAGTNSSVPRLLASLEAFGLGVESVDYVIPTHVHLDHAGGVGLLMQHLPHAQVLVHPRGARHLVDPTALTLGATAVYGEAEMRRTYGRLVPIPAERVQSTADGQELAWRGRTLRFIDTPGHARHHHCIWDSRSRGWFTGDTFGLSYREFDTVSGPWVMPTTTPVQFEPEAMRASIGRMIEADPDCLYLTHYSRIGDPRLQARRLLHLLEEQVQLGLRHAALPAPQRHEAYKAGLRELLFSDLRRHGYEEARLNDGTADGWLALDIELNAQGLAIWVDKQAQAGAGTPP